MGLTMGVEALKTRHSQTSLEVQAKVCPRSARPVSFAFPDLPRRMAEQKTRVDNASKTLEESKALAQRLSEQLVRAFRPVRLSALPTLSNAQPEQAAVRRQS